MTNLDFFGNFKLLKWFKQRYEKSVYTIFRERRVTFFPVNRVEHQKLNQTTPYGAVWLSFWCSTRPSADTSNELVHITLIIIIIISSITGKTFKQASPKTHHFHRIYSKVFFWIRGYLLKNFSSYRRNTCNHYDEIGTNLLRVSAEGRVEHQKLNQTAP